MSNERKLIDFLNQKYNNMSAPLTNEQKMLIETGVAFGIQFAVETVGTIDILNVLGQYDPD